MLLTLFAILIAPDAWHTIPDDSAWLPWIGCGVLLLWAVILTALVVWTEPRHHGGAGSWAQQESAASLSAGAADRYPANPANLWAVARAFDADDRAMAAPGSLVDITPMPAPLQGLQWAGQPPHATWSGDAQVVMRLL